MALLHGAVQGRLQSRSRASAGGVGNAIVRAQRRLGLLALGRGRLGTSIMRCLQRIRASEGQVPDLREADGSGIGSSEGEGDQQRMLPARRPYVTARR